MAYQEGLLWGTVVWLLKNLITDDCLFNVKSVHGEQQLAPGSFQSIFEAQLEMAGEKIMWLVSQTFWSRGNLWTQKWTNNESKRHTCAQCNEVIHCGCRFEASHCQTSRRETEKDIQQMCGYVLICRIFHQMIFLWHFPVHEPGFCKDCWGMHSNLKRLCIWVDRRSPNNFLFRDFHHCHHLMAISGMDGMDHRVGWGREHLMVQIIYFSISFSWVCETSVLVPLALTPWVFFKPASVERLEYSSNL